MLVGGKGHGLDQGGQGVGVVFMDCTSCLNPPGKELEKLLNLAGGRQSVIKPSAAIRLHDDQSLNWAATGIERWDQTTQNWTFIFIIDRLTVIQNAKLQSHQPNRACKVPFRTCCNLPSRA